MELLQSCTKPSKWSCLSVCLFSETSFLPTFRWTSHALCANNDSAADRHWPSTSYNIGHDNNTWSATSASKDCCCQNTMFKMAGCCKMFLQISHSSYGVFLCVIQKSLRLFWYVSCNILLYWYFVDCFISLSHLLCWFILWWCHMVP